MQPAFKVYLLTLLTLLTLGCAESVDTRLEIDRPFSVYGLINPKADTHAVRVFEIESRIQLVRPEPIDAAVTTTLLQNGETQVWRDSVVQLADGDYRHVYWAAFNVTAGETYRLDVVRSDGETTSAVTTVPPPVAVEVLVPSQNDVREARMPLFIRGAPPTLPRIDVEYIVVGFLPESVMPVMNPVLFNYAGQQQERADGWLLEINLFEDFRAIFKIFDEETDLNPLNIELREIVVRVHVGDANWVSPIGTFDADILVEPGVFTNIENGFGYFGAGYVETVLFRPPPELLIRAGFD